MAHLKYVSFSVVVSSTTLTQKTQEIFLYYKQTQHYTAFEFNITNGGNKKPKLITSGINLTTHFTPLFVAILASCSTKIQTRFCFDIFSYKIYKYM